MFGLPNFRGGSLVLEPDPRKNQQMGTESTEWKVQNL